MLRTHTCGILNISDLAKDVTLCGWVQKIRNLGGMTFVDLRDRYGITQLTFNVEDNEVLCNSARKLGREFVISITGKVMERLNKNSALPTGEIEIKVNKLTILNESKIPPFTIENETDGGEEIRMQYRYLDIRRNPIKENLLLRNNIGIEIRNYLNIKDLFKF